jgi:dGTPase
MELYHPIAKNPARQEDRLKSIRGDKEKIEFLRAKAISRIIEEMVYCFLDNEAEMLTGRFDEPLMNQIPSRVEMDRLIEVATEKIYCAPEVVEIETAGFQVISELLERFIQILDDIAEHGDAASPRSKMSVLLIPEQFIGPGRRSTDSAYARLLKLTDFVSGMTDSYAVSLYKKMTGISLPGG